MRGVLAVVFGVCLLGFTAAVKADAVQARPLTNADVIALAKAGMGDDVRSVKLGNSRFFGSRNVGAPAASTEIRFAAFT
jgi:hypothetical protein